MLGDLAGDDDELFGGEIRKGAEQYSVDERNGRRRGAETDCQQADDACTQERGSPNRSKSLNRRSVAVLRSWSKAVTCVRDWSSERAEIRAAIR